MNPLVSAHIEAERRLQRAASTAVSRAWQSLGSWNESDVDQFLRLAVPTVNAAQRQSVAITDAFVARYMGRAPLGAPADEIIAAARKGATPDEVYRRPFVTLWTALKESQPFEDAFNAAMARAASSAAMDVQLAMRDTTDWIDENDSNVYGYLRVANANACPFCLEVDGAYVKGGDGLVMALHNGCNCGVEPQTEPHEGAVNLPDGTEIRPYQYGPLNDNVAVENHGELGPVLGDPAHDFTAL